MPPKKKNYKQNFTFNKDGANWLVIVESPSKCAKIESFLGSNYKCISSKGHIRHIPGLKSINSKNNFEPTFETITEKTAHITFMRSVINQFSKTHILLATDDDREGEAIAWHICEVFGLPIETTPRIIFHEITRTAVLSAVEKPTLINMELVRAQHARQVLDIIVGFKISPILWKYIHNNKDNGYSAGRCQTPALRLVYDNEMERLRGKGVQKKYKTHAKFFQKDLIYELNHDYETEQQVENFLQKSISFNYQLTLGSPHTTTKAPPKPFNTSRLLQTASNVLHISPKETMNLAQVLYQNGHITYMRTENNKYAKPFLDSVKKHIEKTWDSEYLGDLSKLENQDKSNPHEAIRVTHIENSSINTEGKEATLYRLIWKNTIESCMTEAQYSVIESRITAPEEHHYVYKIETPIFLGWQKVSMKSVPSNIENKLYIESLLKTKVLYNSIESQVSFTNHHSHYTEASLINKLEELGIGRPSTFSMLVETIRERGYVNKQDIVGEKVACVDYTLKEEKITKKTLEKSTGNEKAKLVLQPMGKIVIEFLIQYFQELFSYDYTKTMEEKLDLVSNGVDGVEWSQICKECALLIKQLLVPITKITKDSYKVDDKHDLVFMKYGPVIRSLKRSQSDPGARGGDAPLGGDAVDSEGGVVKGSEQYEFQSLKKNIQLDVERLKRGEYSLSELVEKTDDLGEWEGEKLLLKTGRFGDYVEWGENKKSIKVLNKPLEKVTREDILKVLNDEVELKTSNKILRVVNRDCSVRTGRFGAYIYYKPANYDKPKFLGIKKMPFGYMKCSEEELMEWLSKTYDL